MTKSYLRKQEGSLGLNKFLSFINGNFFPYFIMVFPLFLLYIILTVIPTLSTFLFSFTNFNGSDIFKFDWVGLRNYKVLLIDADFWLSMKNTILYSIVVPVVQNLLGLLVALGLNAKIKSKNLLRTVWFSPALISTVVVSYAWTYIFDTNGVLNIILSMFTKDPVQTTWLGEPALALWCVAASNIWRFIGYSAVIFIANLQSISEEMLEAADIDGATSFQKFKSVIFPLMAPSTTINLTLSFIGCLKVFDTVFTMTQGGPGHYSEVIGTYIVFQQMQNLNGYASAMAIILTVVLIILNGIVFPILKRRENNL